jgi:hypothetical protein
MNAIAGRETTDEFITGAPEEMVQKQQAPTPSQEVTVEETQ